MDNEPCTSSETDKSLTAEKECKRKRKGGGGTTCCIPTCNSNTKRNPELSFYRIPSDKNLRKRWLHWIGRANFAPNSYYRVCSKHFVGGKKTCLNNLPTLVQKLLKPTPTKPRTTSKCRDRDYPSEADSLQNEQPSELTLLRDKTLELEHVIETLEAKNKEQKEDISCLEEKVQQCSFSVDRFKNNNTDFELYTGFPNYSTFKAFYNYLSPACERLQYIGSCNRTSKGAVEDKCGPKRMLSPEEELFMCLTRLRLGLLERDLANRFNLSVSQVSRIWVTMARFFVYTDKIHSYLAITEVCERKHAPKF